MQANTKTHERTESAAKAVQAMHRDSVSAKRVQDSPKGSTSFGVKIEPPALYCRNDVVIENVAAVPKSCLSSMEMRTRTVAGGLLPTGKTTTATWTTLDRPAFWFCLTEEKTMGISTTSALYDRIFWGENLLVVPSCRRIIETKSGQNKMFDPGGSEGRLRACPCLETWRELLCGEVHVRAG